MSGPRSSVSEFLASLNRSISAHGEEFEYSTSSSTDEISLDLVESSEARDIGSPTPLVDAIHAGINTFLDDMPVLIEALDEVCKLHPFVACES